MFIGATFFSVVVAATGIVGEGISKDGTVDEEVGYEEIDFLEGIFSTQETMKLASLIVMPMVTKS